MSAEIDVFRAELLRQKIIFEAELRRQRETFDDKIVLMGHQLQDRETDCRNLQNVVTILGKRAHAKTFLEPRNQMEPTALSTSGLRRLATNCDKLSLALSRRCFERRLPLSHRRRFRPRRRTSKPQ